MQPMQPQPSSGRMAGNIALWVIAGWAMTIYAPIRRNFGKDHFGLEAGVGLVWILLWSGFGHAEDLLLLVPVYLVSLLSHRIDSLKRQWRGQFIHTHYTGEPWLVQKLLRVKDEYKAKQFVEPMLSFLFGVFLLPYGDGLGMYFIGGAMALMGTTGMIAAREQRAVDEMRNGMVGNEWLMRELHGQGRRRF